MKDPERFADGHPSALARSLIRAASDERPPSSLLGRTLSSAGIGGAIAASAAAAQAGTAAATSAGVNATAPAATAAAAASSGAGAGAVAAGGTAWLTAVKSVGLVAVAGTLIGAATLQRTPPPPARDTRPPVVQQPAPAAPTGARPSAPPAPIAPEPPAEVAPSETAAVAPSRPPPREAERSSSISLLREEAALIDEAREAVATGDAASALRALERHRQRFSSPRFQPEALYLKMQALRLVGEDAAAQRVARRLLSISPNGPQAAAARAVIQTPEP